MKILVITRIYTGIMDSLRTKGWHPRGIPAYYKLLEALNKKGDDVDAVCLGKVAHNRIARYEKFRFNNLNIDFHVVPYRKIPLVEFHLNDIINDISQFFYCFKLGTKKNYDLIYVDRENIIYGAIFSSFFKKKVVVRLLGIAFLIRRMEGIKRWLKAPFRYLSYKAPFSYVICSKDGSGARYFIERFMNKKVPYEILLNGVDKFEYTESYNSQNNFLRVKYNIPTERKIILFLSRLSKDKGIHLFIEAMLKLSKYNQRFFALIVGDGPLRKELETIVGKSGIQDKVKFEGQIPHDLIYNYFKSSDIYVSLNLAGNLCNTILEALNAGKCIVTFKRDEIDRTDEDTEDILSGNAILIDKRKAVKELAIVLNDLVNDGEKVQSLSERAGALAKDLLPSWEERINYEVELLHKLVSK